MKLVFAGTPEAAVPSLRALAAGPHSIVAVVTRTDAPLGRKRVLTPSPVAAAAAELGLPVLKTNRLDADATAAIDALHADLGVIVAYGGLVREPLLSVPRLGWVNLHFSLLPRWRGAAPVQHAVINGDDITGAVVFQLVPELDAGPVFGTTTRPIGADDTAGSLLSALADDGAELLGTVVDDLAAGTAHPLEQVGSVTLAPKLAIDDARVDWAAPATAVLSRVRGVTPEPGAFTTVGDGRLKLLEVAPAADAPAQPAGAIRLHENRLLVGTGTLPVELRVVQPAGKKPMPALDWWRGTAAAADRAGELVAS
ncbi:methionyl-tRNA formyltransferase [Glaciibacter sp. 2TAF33]|uniref:methionyl-tRNA formyltransferase n=1 Tax=Glaciibacter sp. 2TAF33 TaxID=3233015 RepID=UPI003F91DAB7